MKRSEKKLIIISNESGPFADREEAGRLLSRELKAYKGNNTVVLGIPRGGMIVAGSIARELGCGLDIIISRKLRAPGNPELAIGAVTENGKVFLNGGFAGASGADKGYISGEVAYQLGEIQRRISLFRAVKPKIGLKGKTVIVTDDGLATGLTMQAALWSARQENPEMIIAALPVAPQDSLEMIAETADRTVCLRVPRFFYGVGQFYRDFSQTDDEEVLEILRRGKPG